MYRTSTFFFVLWMNVWTWAKLKKIVHAALTAQMSQNWTFLLEIRLRIPLSYFQLVKPFAFQKFGCHFLLLIFPEMFADIAAQKTTNFSCSLLPILDQNIWVCLDEALGIHILRKHAFFLF